LAYQLEFFERSKFKEVTVITHKKFYEEIDIYLSEKFQGYLKFIKLRKMKVDILSVNNEKNLSSLELFQVIKNKITVKIYLLESFQVLFYQI